MKKKIKKKLGHIKSKRRLKKLEKEEKLNLKKERE